MGHKAAPRRTGKLRRQIVPWAFKAVMKVPKKAKGSQKQLVVVHTPPEWKEQK